MPHISPPVDIGSRRELFLDGYLIDTLDGVRLSLQTPKDEGPVFFLDRPWEGRYCGYFTVIKDGETVKLYYRGKPGSGNAGTSDEVTCYAESPDGIEWIRPSLNIVESNGTLGNNIILGPESPPIRHNFTPFLDNRPGVDDSERFKALGGLFDHGTRAATTHGLLLYTSADGIRWRRSISDAVINQSHRNSLYTDTSSNPAFWSEVEDCYVCYVREWKDVGEGGKMEGMGGTIRWIGRTTSPDLTHWTPIELMNYEPIEHFYVSNTQPYFRAPHIYVALPARFMKGRQVVSAEEARQIGISLDWTEDCSEPVIMTSRGGNVFDRTFKEGLIRPGIGPQHWISRTNYPVLNVVQTGPTEMSLYLNHEYAQDSSHLRRYSLRLDGFASVQAPYAGGEMVTRLFKYDGTRLLLNFSTSAAGGIRVEMQSSNGKPLLGLELENSDELIGNQIERAVSWVGDPDLSEFAGQTVRLRFVMKDSDLFSMRFQ